jgi:hypothetical protein
MAGEWRRASQAYGVSYGLHPFGMLAPVAPVGNPTGAETTTTTVDGTLTIGRFVVRLLLTIRRTRRE